MLFFICIRSFFVTFCVFLYIITYILNITKAIKTISITEIKYFIFENYYKRIGFSKESSYYSLKRLNIKRFVAARNKLMKNIPDPQHSSALAEEHNKLFIIKEIRKSVKKIRNSYLSTKNFSNSRHC